MLLRRKQLEIKTEEITEKELKSILEFYFGKLYIYNYCYKNSLEFKNFIDNCSEERRRKIKKLQFTYAKRPIITLDIGMSADKLKQLHDNQLKELLYIIQSDSFKTFFSDFDNILLSNKLYW